MSRPEPSGPRDAPGARTAGGVRGVAGSPAGRRDGWIAWGVFAAFALLYAAAAQEAYWSDGRSFLRGLETGGWKYGHIAYLPLAHALHACLRPFVGEDGAPTLLVLSIVPAALGAAFLYRALRARGRSVPAALVATGLAGLAPGVLFFATTIELHALSYAVACAILWWVASAERRGRLGEDALVPTLLATALFATHYTAPVALAALAVAVLASPRPRRLPARWPAALVLVAAFACLWVWIARPERSPHFAFLGRGLERSFRFHHEELLTPLGALAPLAAVSSLDLARRRPRRLLRPLPLAGLVMAGSYTAFAFYVYVYERGAYFLPVAALAAFVAGTWLDRLPARGLAAVVLLLPLQAFLSRGEIVAWRDARPPWLPTLVAETGSEGLFLAATRPPGSPPEPLQVYYHSRKRVIGLGSGGELDLDDPLVTRFVRIHVRDELEAGRPVAVERALLESTHPGVRRIFRQLARIHGELRPGEDETYLVLDPGGGANVSPGRDRPRKHQ